MLLLLLCTKVVLLLFEILFENIKVNLSKEVEIKKWNPKHLLSPQSTLFCYYDPFLYQHQRSHIVHWFDVFFSIQPVE